MKIDKKIIEHFKSLIRTCYENLSTSFLETTHGEELAVLAIRGVPTTIDTERTVRWGLSSLNLISRVFGESSSYYKKFDEIYPKFSLEENREEVKKALAILHTAKDDYENNYLFDTRTLIEAEVFDDFLEQAEELLRKKYHGAAAVITGCVLEDGLRKLCKRNGITVINQGTKSISVDDATIDPMNVELAKAGIYNALWQKKITALADLRNKAAHGKWTEFTEKDVEDMIRDVRRFMEDYFS